MSTTYRNLLSLLFILASTSVFAQEGSSRRGNHFCPRARKLSSESKESETRRPRVVRELFEAPDAERQDESSTESTTPQPSDSDVASNERDPSHEGTNSMYEPELDDPTAGMTIAGAEDEVAEMEALERAEIEEAVREAIRERRLRVERAVKELEAAVAEAEDSAPVDRSDDEPTTSPMDAAAEALGPLDEADEAYRNAAPCRRRGEF
ncbi:MAG: hypothetical protein AAF517_03085 [Planctomycetota bacterium]